MMGKIQKLETVVQEQQQNNERRSSLTTPRHSVLRSPTRPPGSPSSSSVTSLSAPSPSDMKVRQLEDQLFDLSNKFVQLLSAHAGLQSEVKELKKQLAQSKDGNLLSISPKGVSLYQTKNIRFRILVFF